MFKGSKLAPVRKLICRTCDEPFIPRHNKPGSVLDCEACAVENTTTYVAKVAYPSKNSCLVEIEITKDHASADAFNNAQRRNGGTSVTMSCVQRKS